MERLGGGARGKRERWRRRVSEECNNGGREQNGRNRKMKEEFWEDGGKRARCRKIKEEWRDGQEWMKR